MDHYAMLVGVAAINPTEIAKLVSTIITLRQLISFVLYTLAVVLHATNQIFLHQDFT